MSYRLKTDEPLTTGVRRIAREQLEGALQKIGPAVAGQEAEPVHSTRKHIKKARTLLRLVRDEIGKEIYRRENRLLADVARSFSDARDARVCLEMVQILSEQCGQKDAFPKTIAALKTEIEDASGSFASRQGMAEKELLRLFDQIEGWPLDNLGMDDLCSALKDAYRVGRKLFRRAECEATPENFHSWRKRVKHVWYQSRILRELNCTFFCELADAAGTLGEHLGDLHDLTFLRSWLEKDHDSPDDERAILLGLVCIRERELEKIALDLGARFFAEKPGAFERRVIRYAGNWPESVSLPNA